VKKYKKKILIIDNEIRTRNILTEKLTSLGYRVILASNGQEGLSIFNEEKLNLIILDILLSKLDGYELCLKIRKQSQIPIIIVTALGSISERVCGLNLGADDYIIKPFSPNELEVRIRSVLRRNKLKLCKYEPNPPKRFYIGSLVIDTQTRQVLKKDILIQLTKIEFDLFQMLIENAGKKLSRETILDNVWGYSPERYGDNRLVDVNISRLRQKIEDIPNKPIFILTLRGKGYMFPRY